MASSAWVCTEGVDVQEGTRYRIFLNDDIEVFVLHAPGKWKAWNGHAMCEVTAAMKAAVLEYERA